MPKKKAQKKAPKKVVISVRVVPNEKVPIAKQKRVPKKGDRVAALGHHGTFVVSDVDKTIEAVELRMIGRGVALSTIPWATLTYLD
jgi:hypothetical protein